jgi:hypothetical protein
MADKDVIPEVPNATGHHKARVFPLVPTLSRKEPVRPAPARPPREDDMGVAALIQKPFQLPESHLHQHHHSKSDSANENKSTSHKVPPSIRVISAEAEKESQKPKRPTTWTPYSNVGFYVLASATR